jgi:hypothetical protein
MTIESIGSSAGLEWRALSTSGKMSSKELKKVCKFKTEKELFSGLGWLAKEGKLVFEEQEGDLFVWLV